MHAERSFSTSHNINHVATYSSKVNQTFQALESNFYKFKIIMLGDVAVGKTSILTRYVDNEFKSVYNCTIGVEYKIKKIKIDKITEAELKIWDTCGSEKYRTITRQYYLDTQGVVLVFDLTNRITFEKVNVWLNDLKENVPTDYCVILVGNKSDIKERDILLSDEARKFAIRNKMAYIEVSAKQGTNVVSLFENITKKMINKWEQSENSNNKGDALVKGNTIGLKSIKNTKKTGNIKINKGKGSCC